MAVQLRDPNEGKLSAVADAFASALLQKKNRELEERRLAIEQQRANQGDRQLDIAQAGLDAETRAAALDKAIKISAILPPGASPRSYPALLPIFREAFPEIPDEDFMAFSDIPWSRRTLKDAIEEASLEILDKLPPDSPMRERITNNQLVGKAVTESQLNIEGRTSELQGLQLDIMMDGMREIKTDPEVIRNATLAQLGLSPEFTIPGVTDKAGQPIKFSSETGANIWAQLLMQTNDLTFKLNTLSSESKTDLAAEIMKLGEQVEAPLGRAAAMEILNAYETSARGNFEDGKSPLDSLMARSNEGQKRVIQAFVGSIDTSKRAWLDGQPESVRNFIQAGTAVREIFGLEGDAAETALKKMVETGLVGGVTTQRGWNPFNTEFSFSRGSAGATVLNDQQTQLLAEDLAAGLTEEQIINDMKQFGVAPSAADFQRARDLAGGINPGAGQAPPARAPSRPQEQSSTGGTPPLKPANPARRAGRAILDNVVTVGGALGHIDRPTDEQIASLPIHPGLQSYVQQRGTSAQDLPAVIRAAADGLRIAQIRARNLEQTIAASTGGRKKLAESQATDAIQSVQNYKNIIDRWLAGQGVRP